MTKARDTANIVGGGFSGTIAGATMEPTGDTAAGDNAAIGFTSAEGLIITGQGSTGDVTIKNDADALVAHVPTGTTGVNFAGDVIVPDGDLILGSTAVTATGAELNILDGVTTTAAEINLIDGGTARGTTAVADGDGFLTNDGGTMRMTKVDTLATYMGTKIGGGLEFIASLDASSSATLSFTGFDPSKYDSYLFTFHAIEPADDDVDLRFYTSSDTSSHSYDSGSTDYVDAMIRNGAAVGGIAQRAYGALVTDVGTGSGELGFYGSCEILAAHLAKRTFIISNGWSYNSGGNLYHYERVVFRDEAAQVNAIRFFMQSGNIASGTITMYGMVNS